MVDAKTEDAAGLKPAQGPARHAILGIARASVVIAGITVGVKAFGMARDSALAGFFGTSLSLDAFLLAYAVVSFFVNLFVGTFNAAYIPVYLNLKSKEGEDASAHFQSVILLGLVLAMLCVCLALLACNAPILRMLAPRMAADHLMLLRPAFLSLLPLLPLSACAFTLAGTLQAEGKFAVAAWTPVLSITACLAALEALAHKLGPFSMVVGLLVGGLLEVAALIWALRRISTFRKPRWDSRVASAVRTVAAQYLPVMSGAMLMSSTTLVDLAMAGRLDAGSVSTLSFANKIPAAFLSIASGALGTATLPFLSSMVVKQEWRSIRETLKHYLVRTLGWGTVVALCLAAASKLMVHLVYEHGAFGPEQAQAVARIQVMYLLQIPFYISGILMVRFISAVQRTRILFYGNIVSAGLNIGLDLLFMRQMGPSGIALSTTVVYIVSFFYIGAWTRQILKAKERVAYGS